MRHPGRAGGHRDQAWPGSRRGERRRILLQDLGMFGGGEQELLRIDQRFGRGGLHQAFADKALQRQVASLDHHH
ncbi:hypothetical protein D9M70_629630 [compost metagenome]